MAGPAYAGIDGFTCTPQSGNNMRYVCTVSLDEPVTVSVGFRPSAGGPWKWSHARYGDATTPVEVTLSNFEPDVAYTGRAKILGSGSGTLSADTSLGTPTLPSDLEGFQAWDPDFNPGSSWRLVADLGWSPPDVDHGPPPPGCSGGHRAGYLDGTFADWAAGY